MKVNFSDGARELREREVLIISRKLNFGLPKKANAVVGKGDTV